MLRVLADETIVPIAQPQGLPSQRLVGALFETSSYVVAILTLDYVALGQQQPASDNPPQPENKRIFGFIPNYRTSPDLRNYAPIPTREKFKIAAEDSFDPDAEAAHIIESKVCEVAASN